MGKFVDLTGQRFGRLIVLERRGTDKHGKVLWLCQCDCGNSTMTTTGQLKSGKTSSCGCLHNELLVLRNTKHGKTNTRLYRIYEGIKTRCYSNSYKEYYLYGGRGITVCEEWKSDFMNFYNWAMENGYSDDLTIDRIDVDGNYEPSNCRWATAKEQANNTRKTNYLIFNGIKKSFNEWSVLVNIKTKTLKNRFFNLGWSAEKTLRTPVNNIRR